MSVIILIIIAAVVIIYFASRSNVSSDNQRSVPRTLNVQKSSEYVPVFEPLMVEHQLLPAGRSTVVGEQFHIKDIEFAIGERADEVKPVGQWGKSLEIKATIRLDSRNPYDSNAVAVLLGNRVVGYIPSDKTLAWRKLLKPLEARGEYASAVAAIYSSDSSNSYAVVLSCDPSIPGGVNEFPGGTLLAAERQVSVSGEEAVQETLANYGEQTFVYATLSTGLIPKGKYKDTPTIYAAVDGQQVGYVSAMQSERYLSYVRRSLPCSCLAFIKRGKNKLELDLMLPGLKS